MPKTVKKDQIPKIAAISTTASKTIKKKKDTRPSSQPKKAQTSIQIFTQQMNDQMGAMKKFKNVDPVQRGKIIQESWSKLTKE